MRLQGSKKKSLTNCVASRVEPMRYIEIVGLDGAGKSRLCRSFKWKLGDRSYVIHAPSHDYQYRKLFVMFQMNACLRSRVFLPIWQRIQKPMTVSYLLVAPVLIFDR